jgi:hypothetical protein
VVAVCVNDVLPLSVSVAMGAPSTPPPLIPLPVDDSRIAEPLAWKPVIVAVPFPAALWTNLIAPAPKPSVFEPVPVEIWSTNGVFLIAVDVPYFAITVI